MSGTIVDSLTADLKDDAEKLASGKPVSAEIERKTIGRIGLLVCEIAGQLWTPEQLHEVSRGIAAKLVEDHAKFCRFTAETDGGGSAVAGGKTLVGRVLDKYFLHIWWGFVALCCIFGVQEVVGAVLTGIKAAHGG